MEYVAFTTTQLQYLGDQDQQLAPYFVGVFAADELPASPRRDIPQAYIVNTDPRTQPGTHWIALYTNHGRCDVMDSYGLPYTYYSSPFERWIARYWKEEDVTQNTQTLQTVFSHSCGQYALMYLKYRVRGRSLDDFLDQFKKHDYVYNDHKVGQMTQRAIVNTLFYPACCLERDQTNGIKMT